MSEPTDLIRAADAALDGITPGPWTSEDTYVDSPALPNDDYVAISAWSHVDARFIASAPKLVKDLRHALATALDDNRTLADAYRSEHDRALRLAIRAVGAEEVQSQRDEAREQLRLALIDQANTEAALAEANATIAALREREETAGHIADVEMFKAVEANAELVKAQEAIERVRALEFSSDDGSLWEDAPEHEDCGGSSDCPGCWAQSIRRAIEGLQS